MKYRKLARMVGREFNGSPYLLGWDADNGEINYNIVPLPHGIYVIHTASGRGGWFRRQDDDSLPIVFTSEDDVCEYVWKKLTAPRPAPTIVAPRSPQEIEAQLERNAELKVRLKAQLEARGEPPYPNEVVLDRAVARYLGAVDHERGMAAVADTASEQKAPLLVAAVEDVVAAADSLFVDENLVEEQARFGAIFRAVAGRNSQFDTETVVLLAERRFARHP